MKPIDELFVLADTDLYELHDRLWYEYFTPLEPHDKKTAQFIRQQLNAVAAHIKIESMDNPDATHHGLLKMVEPSDKYEVDELGPNWLKPIYVETALPAPLLPSYKVRGKKLAKVTELSKAGRIIKGPPMPGDDEDLLGDAKPKKVKFNDNVSFKLPKQTGGKTNYEIVSELAAKGMDKDQIQAASGLARKTVTDNLWRYNKEKSKKK